MDATLEAIYLLNEVFYAHPDLNEWPESAKQFRVRMIAIVGRLIHASRLSPEEVKRILEETRS